MATRLSDTPILSPDPLNQGATGNVRSSREQYFNDVTFICHLCNDTVKRATFLSCLHSFCKQCVVGKLQKEAQSMECPLCPSFQDHSVELQSNPLPELVSKLKELKSVVRDETKKLQCTDCVFGKKSMPAVAYCVECNATICQIDMKSHEKYSVGHIILELNQLHGSTVQDILSRLQTSHRTKLPSNESIKKDVNRDLGTEREAATPLSSSSAEIEDECILEGRSLISQLEKRKDSLEKEWNKQIAQTVEFFQQLHMKLEARQTAVLEELSQLYHPLMAPLQDAIRRLERTVTYTGYVGALGRYSRAAGVSGKPEEKIKDISIFLSNFIILSDPYHVDVKEEDQLTIQNSINAYLTLKNVADPSDPGKITPLLFQSKKHICHEIGQKMTCTKYITPIDVAFHPTTNTYYVLFDSCWKTYQQLRKLFVERETVEINSPTSIPINYSIALLADSVYIMANNEVYVYSDKGKFSRQLHVQTQIGAIFPNPKLYTFNDINFLYLAYLQSSQVYVFNVIGTHQGSCNLVKDCRNMPEYTGYANFVDMVRSPVKKDQVLILHSVYPTHQPPPLNSTNNQYYIRIYNMNMQYCGTYSLSQPMSLFCCLTAHGNTLYVLDVSTGCAHLYNFNEMQTEYPQDYYGGRYYQNYYLWNQKYLFKNTVPMSPKLVGQVPKDTMIRAFSSQQFKNQVMLFSDGIINCVF